MRFAARFKICIKFYKVNSLTFSVIHLRVLDDMAAFLVIWNFSPFKASSTSASHKTSLTASTAAASAASKTQPVYHELCVAHNFFSSPKPSSFLLSLNTLVVTTSSDSFYTNFLKRNDFYMSPFINYVDRILRIFDPPLSLTSLQHKFI